MAKTKKDTSKKTAPKKKVKFVFKMPNFKNFNVKGAGKVVGLILIIVGSFALIDLGVQYLNNDYSIAVVNGVRVPKSDWYRVLDQAYGEAAATQLIEESIIKQEAKAEDIEVTEEEIQEQLDEVISSIGGQDLYESALEANNITEEELKEQIELDLMMQKILEPSISYTEDDVKEFFDQYSDVLFADDAAALEDGEKLSYDDYKDQTEEIYLQQQVSTEQTTWLAEKEAEYRIQNNSTDKPKYGFLTTTVNIINNLLNSDVEESEE